MDADQPQEFTGEDVEAAIAAGLAQLGVGPNDVLVEVIDEPSRGVFGIGAKPARVRLKLLRRPEPPQPVAEPEPVYEPDDDTDDIDEEEDDDTDDIALADEVDESELEDDAIVGRRVLGELIEKMGIEGKVVVRRAEANRPGENAPWLLDIDGPNINTLIGRRGDTLSSLQYITRLITSRHLQRRANIIVDAGGYKSLRSDRLKQLAMRMADQAVNQARTVTLEPMPPNERRIIHLTLRPREDVETQSTGEGNSRKVMIIPK